MNDDANEITSGLSPTEQEQRAQVLEASVNFRGLLTITAGMLRRSNPAAAGALYVLERDVYESVSTGIMLVWPEDAPDRDGVPAPAPKRAARRPGCRYEYKGGDVCTKCGEARQRRRKTHVSEVGENA